MLYASVLWAVSLISLGVFYLTPDQFLLVAAIGAFFGVIRILPVKQEHSLTLASFSTGFLVPCLPGFGATTVAIIALLFLLFFYLLGSRKNKCLWDKNEKQSEQAITNPPWAWAYMLVVLTHVVSEIVYSSHLGIIGGLDLNEGWTIHESFKGIALWAMALPPPLQLIISQVSVLTAFVWMATFLLKNPHVRKRYLNGIVCGMIPASLIFAAEVIGIHGGFSLNQSEFFASLGRHGGSFSDPNSAGIFLFLMAPVLWVKTAGIARGLSVSLMVVIIVMAVFTGSRSFWLATGLFTLLCVLRTKWLKVYLLGALLFVLLINCVSLTYPYARQLYAEILPVGMSRALEALLLENYQSTFFSRLTFMKIGWEAFKEHLLVGLGYGHFRMWVPVYAQKLHLGTGLWSDNSNNFYLGILAELGLVGFVALLIGVSYFRFNSAVTREVIVLRNAFIVFLLILVIGPHLDFIEVSLLVAWYMSVVCNLNTSLMGKKSLMAFSVCSIILIVANSFFLERGFFYWEEGPGGRFRWSGRSAQGYLSCDNDNKAALSLRAVNPDLGQHPLSIKLFFPHMVEGVELSLDNSALRTVSVECPVNYELIKPGNRKIRYVIRVSRSWSPVNFGLGNDPRLLGVQVYEEQYAQES